MWVTCKRRVFSIISPGKSPQKEELQSDPTRGQSGQSGQLIRDRRRLCFHAEPVMPRIFVYHPKKRRIMIIRPLHFRSFFLKNIYDYHDLFFWGVNYWWGNVTVGLGGVDWTSHNLRLFCPSIREASGAFKMLFTLPKFNWHSLTPEKLPKPNRKLSRLPVPNICRGDVVIPFESQVAPLRATISCNIKQTILNRFQGS